MPLNNPIFLATSIYFGWILVIHIPQSYHQFLFVKKCYHIQRHKILGIIPVPRLNVWSFLFVNLIFCASLIFIILAPGDKLFLAIALISYFLYFGQILEMANVRKKTNMIPLVLFILLLAPISADMQSDTYELTIMLLQLAVVQMYISSGIQKLRASGLRWMDGKTLQATCLYYYAWSDNKLAFRLGRNLSLCRALSIATLLFECTFWLIFLFPWLTIPYLVIGFLFHLGTSLTLKIHYIYYFLPAYIWLLIDYLGQ